MKFSKFLIIVFVMILVSVVFSACSQNNTSVETDSSNTTNAAEESSITSKTAVEPKSKPELDIKDTNQSQLDREEEETSNEYLDYYSNINDDKTMSVSFDGE